MTPLLNLLLPHNFPLFTLIFLVLKVFLSSPSRLMPHFHTQRNPVYPSMADSRSYSKPHFSPQDLQPNPSKSSRKSSTHVLCKSLVFLLFVVAIPLFPSQAPDFISQTIFTKFWELFHLLFIGLAVCYGLFSRRNVEVDFEPHSSYFDDSQSSFVSRIFHVSPIFEDGSDSQSACDEKYVYQMWNSQFSEPMINVANESTVIDEQRKDETFSNSEIGTEIPLEHDENSVVQAWNSQYFQGESVAVVSQPNYTYNEWGKPRVGGYQPLGLPVRSLNTGIGNPDSPQLSNGSESGSGSSGDSPMSREEENGDMGPMNLELEEKFNESISFPSQIPWRSRSGRQEFKERVSPVSNLSQFRPLSVNETQIESFKSQSFRSAASYSSQASSISNSPNMLSPSHSSCSDSPNSRTEESGNVKEQDTTYALAFQSPQTAKNGEARLNAFHLRRYSSGSLFQKDSPKKAEDELKDLRRKRRENPSGTKDSEQGSLTSDTKPAMIIKDMPKKAEDDLSDLRSKKREDSSGSKETVQGSVRSDTKSATVIKASSRGKSVRTIRSGVYAPEAIKAGETSTNQINDKVAKGYDDAKTLNVGKNEMKEEGVDNMSSGLSKKKEMKEEGVDNMSSGLSKKNLDSHHEVPKPTHPKFQQIEKEEVTENASVKSEQESESEIEECQPKLSNDIVSDAASDAGHDPYEVDKKAGEFIAKFREQIRLQKVASMGRSKGLRLSGKYSR